MAVSNERHTNHAARVKAAANPFDLKWRAYFAKRDECAQHNLWIGTQPREVWQQEHGKCPRCHQQITAETRWNVHHVIAKSHGGSDNLDNLVLLHPNCHRQVHSLGLAVVKLGSVTGLSKGLSRMWEKLAVLANFLAVSIRFRTFSASRPDFD
jgi:uncharacterized paraquat-inducible protein A